MQIPQRVRIQNLDWVLISSGLTEIFTRMIKLKFKPQICFDSWTKNVKYHHIIVIGNKGPKDKWLKVILGVKLYSITISYHNTPDVSNASSVQYWLLVTIHYWPYQYNTSRQINIRAGRKIRIWGQPIYSNSQIKRFQSRNTFLQCLVSMHGVEAYCGWSEGSYQLIDHVSPNLCTFT